MSREVTVLVADSDETADALAARRSVVVSRTDSDDIPATLHPDHDVVVLAGATLLDESAVAAVESAGVPVVVYGPEPPTASWLSGFVRRTDDSIPHLLDEIRHAVDGETRLQLRRRRRQLAKLHDGAAELAAVRSVEALYDRTMGVAGDVLTFDHGLLLVREDDRLVTVASSGSGDWAPESEPLGDSLAGETLTASAPRLVDDLAADERARRHHDDTHSAISVPVGDDAVFQVSSTNADAFDTTDLEVAQLLATHIEETRERLLAEASARNRSDRITALHRAATDLIDADDATAVYDRTVEIAAEVLQFDHCLLAEATDDGFLALASANGVRTPGERVANRGRGVAEETFRAGETIVVDDATTTEEAEPTDDSFAAALSVPFGDVGVFQAISTETGTYDDTDRELAELLVSYATTTLERIESEQALRESQQTIERLHEAATEIASAETETEVLDRAIEAAANVLAFDLCTIDIADDEEGMLYPVAISDAESVESTPSSIEDGIAGKTYREGEPFVVADLAADKDADPTKSEYRSVISVPVGDIGVFQAVSTQTGAFGDDDADRAELLMAHVAVSLERVHAEAGLRDERDRFSALFENIPDAVVSFEMLDAGPLVRDVNEAFEQTFGYDAEELHGENLDDYIVPGADEEIDDDASELNQRLRAGQNVRKECRRLTDDGIRDFLMYVVPLELGTENVAGYAIYSDITERKERERELRRQNERLDEFASVVSHDLRNPISIADGWIDMARKSGEDEHFDKIQSAVNRMEDLVEDLLTLAREGEVVGDAESHSLPTIAETAWSHVDTAQATLDTTAVADDTVEADSDRLEELFENLYRNAIEHGGTDVRIRVEDTETGFAIADDGPGVPPEEREEVFEAGVTNSEAGTGFGLPIVKRIAEAHGWSVHLEESWAGGARFVFEFEE